MSTPFTKEKMVEWLGSIDEHDDDSTGDRPESLKYIWFSKMKIWQPGMPDHGWSAGIHRSPYPNDHGFVLVVLNCRSAFRMSKYSPAAALDFLGQIGASLRELDYVDNDFMELEHGVSEVAKSLGNMWKQFRTAPRGDPEPQVMSSAGQEFIGHLILAFSHEEKPLLAKSLMMRTVGLVKIDAARADADLKSYRADWSDALERAATEEARSHQLWRGQRGLKASVFQKACATLVAGYMEKLTPEFSVHYTMDHTVAQEGIGAEWLGESTFWSSQVLVPYLDQRAGQIKIQKMMRGMWWVDFDGEKQFFPEDSSALML